MRRHRPRAKAILRCPQCGSDRIVMDAGMITGQRYHCLACNYLGSFVVEQDMKLPDPDEDSD